MRKKVIKKWTYAEDIISEILECLKASKNKMTIPDIAEKIGTSSCNVNRYMRAIRYSGSSILQAERHKHGAYYYSVRENAKIRYDSIKKMADEYRRYNREGKEVKAKKAVKIPLKQRIKRILIKFILGL